MDHSPSKPVFFHVGMGRTGTTFLQARVFPKLTSIHYIRNPQYRRGRYAQLIERGEANRYLVSHEFDQDLEPELHNIAAKLPHARIILVLRRPDQWIASQYRRKVKNGYRGSFRDFFDIHHDQGDWKQRVLGFYQHIRLIEQLFTHKPLVLLYDELKQDPFVFLDKIAAYTGASYRREAIDTTSKHASYEEQQLNFLYWLNSRLPGKARRQLSPYKGVRQFQQQLIKVPRFALMKLATLAPAGWLPGRPLIDEAELETIRASYQEDWEQCLAYVRANHHEMAVTSTFRNA